MPTLPLFQVDAFAKGPFTGNPAAVCPLDAWLEDAKMQAIAEENNLAETAFLVPNGSGYEIRWFTPTVEVDLCGHATLAAAHVVLEELGWQEDMLPFYSPRSGALPVQKRADQLLMNFPADEIEKVDALPGIEACIGRVPQEIWQGKTDYMAVLDSQQAIEQLQPHMYEIAQLPCRGLIVTAKGDEVDLVSRFFAPQSGVPEDHVTGSAHTTLVPYWASKLGKNTLSAIQLSQRKGWLSCTLLGDRIDLSGKTRLYMKGEIYV